MAPLSGPIGECVLCFVGLIFGCSLASPGTGAGASSQQSTKGKDPKRSDPNKSEKKAATKQMG